MSNPRTQLESRLAEQAEQIVPWAVTPTAGLLKLHAKRQRRIRRNRVLISFAVALPLLSFVANRVLRKPSTEHSPATIAQHAPVSPVPEANAGSLHTDLEEQAFAELVRFVSEQTGTQARLVAMPDEDGVIVPAIYIPERATPVQFQQLSLAERHAVTRVLNQTISDAI